MPTSRNRSIRNASSPRCAISDCRRRAHETARPAEGESSRRWPALRRLSEYVAPAGRRAHVDVAEPQRVIEGLVLVPAFDPEQRRHHRRVAPDANSLLAVFLTLETIGATARFVEQVRFAERLAAARDQHEI